MWISNLPILRRIVDDLDVDLDIAIESKLDTDEDVKDIDPGCVLQMHRSFTDRIRSSCRSSRKRSPPTGRMQDSLHGKGLSMWGMTTVDHEDAVQCYLYMQASGDENFRRLFRFIDSKILGSGKEVLPPEELPYEAVVDLDIDMVYNTTEETLVLKEQYLKVESLLEEKAGEGEFQGGSVNIYSQSDVNWDDHGVSGITDSIRKKRTSG